MGDAATEIWSVGTGPYTGDTSSKKASVGIGPRTRDAGGF